LGHELCVEYAISDEAMQKALDLFDPDIIVCPYLTKKLPCSIWEKRVTLIVHPGIKGDRGASSLDRAIMRGEKEWGVTVLQANDEIDAGPVWATADFTMRDAPKASLYRREVATAASKALKIALDRFIGGGFVPQPLDYSRADVKGFYHSVMRQNERKIDWSNETAETIIRKINAADSLPGVLDTLLGVECYLFGAHKEDTLRGSPKELLAKRNGAVCIGTKDGALWVSHLKEKGEKKIKLPAVYVLKERLQGVKESRIPLMLETKRETFKEITYEQKGEVGYLGFSFHNGAMSAEQCVRLKYAVETAKERDIKVLVFLGGEDFFSNGIHLNIMEDSKKKAEDGWSNIHSMNELVKTVLFSCELLTVAALRGSAGAGGVSLAAACDFVIARDGVVLNPHYMTMGLYGSEYWTYTLPKRAGDKKAQELMQECLPIGAKEAKRIGLVDEIFGENESLFCTELESFAASLAGSEKYYDMLYAKVDTLRADDIDKYKEKELEKMYPSFYDETSLFHKLRHDFVYKVCPAHTPKRFKQAKS